MQQELALKAITHSTVGIAILMLLLLLLVSLRRETQGGEPIGGMVHFGIAMHVHGADGRIVLREADRRAGENIKPVGHGSARHARPACRIREAMSEVRITVFVTNN